MGSGATGGSSPEEQRAADLAAGVEARAEDLAAETRRKADDLAGATRQRAVDLAAETAAKALALASALGDTLTEIARRLDRYSAFGRRSRRIIIALAVSFTADIVLTVVLGFTALSAHDTASTSAQLVQEVHMQQSALHAAQLQACAGGNTFRADQDVIWKDFIGILTTPTPTSTKAEIAKADKLAAQFLAYVSKVNHPVNCTALYGK